MSPRRPATPPYCDKRRRRLLAGREYVPVDAAAEARHHELARMAGHHLHAEHRRRGKVVSEERVVPARRPTRDEDPDGGGDDQLPMAHDRPQRGNALEVPGDVAEGAPAVGGLVDMAATRGLAVV